MKAWGHHQGSFFRLHGAKKHPKKSLATKDIKIQEFFWMKSQMAKMDEN
jgi:hypothetical protein